MKIALVLTGYMRNWEEHFHNIKTNIIDKYSTDVFISSSTYSAATYQVQIKKGSDYHTTSINLLHAGGNVYISEYGTIKTGISLATFDADINSGNVRLLATPTSSDSTVFKVFRTTMNA